VRLVVPRPVAGNKGARWWPVAGWPESRSDGCARNLWGARATGSDRQLREGSRVELLFEPRWSLCINASEFDNVVSPLEYPLMKVVPLNPSEKLPGHEWTKN
jgi:hypothetical protein